MLKVAIFIDGKNFYTSWRERANGRRLDFGALSRWLANVATGQRPSMLTGVHYYTGVESDPHDEGTQKLHRFLDQLELEPGFFVTRLYRRQNRFHCGSCQAENAFTQEREVDTTMTADMIRLAATNAFDVMVLVSGDTDHVPAVEAVRSLGKVVYVASWGGNGLAPRLRRAVFDGIDMLAGVSYFEIKPSAADSAGPSDSVDPTSPRGERPSSEPPSSLPEATAQYASRTEVLVRPTSVERESNFLANLRRAQEAFHPGYVGVNYFVTRWRGVDFEDSPPERRQTLDRLVQTNAVEVYDVNGNKALRVRA